MLSSLGLLGQKNYSNGFQMTGQVQMGIPQNDFEQVLSSYPVGLAASVTTPIGKTQLLRFGVEYGWNSLGKEKTLVELQDEANQVLAGEMDFSSEIRKYHALVRLAPFTGGFRPYFEVMLGMTSYQSETELGYENTDGIFVTELRPAKTELVNSYGYSGGLMIGLGSHVFLDGKVQILRSGGEVKVVDDESLTVGSDGSIDYDLNPVKTDLLVPHVGLSVVF